MPVTKKARRAASAAAASGILAAGALTLGTGSAHASTLDARGAHHSSTGYSFETLNNAGDLTFNQLLGINDADQIAGYFGSGAAGHPNKGYQLLLPPAAHIHYVNENFPHSVQTQVTGLNNKGVTVGFWSSMNNASMVNDNHGFVEFDGRFRNADFPTGSPASPPVDQLLGINDSNIAVGFYVDAAGTSHGYEYNLGSNRFTQINEPSMGLTAAAINDSNDVAGFYVNFAGVTDGFFLTPQNNHFTTLAFPGAMSTMALGVSGRGEVVGVYTDAANNMHGFTWTARHGFTTVDDPNGAGTTTINGVNDRGQLVGFYVDANGNTDGFVATPR
jgi:hypothetical protein